LAWRDRDRHGRGFTLQELKAAGIDARSAHTIGIAVDRRRHNKSVESLNTNVQRLKFYKANLVVYPRKTKKGQEKPQLPAPTQYEGEFPFSQRRKPDAPVKITDQMKSVSGLKTLRAERMKLRRVGLAARKAQKEANSAGGQQQQGGGKPK